MASKPSLEILMQQLLIVVAFDIVAPTLGIWLGPGFIQQLRGPNFTQFWPPTIFRVDNCGHFTWVSYPHVTFLLSTKVPTYLILSTQSLNDPRHCRRYTCRDRSVKHLFSSDVIDQSVCRMLRNHIGHICNVCQMVPNVNVVDMVRESSILWKLVILKYKVCKSSCGRQKSKWLASFVWQMPQK